MGLIFESAVLDILFGAIAVCFCSFVYLSKNYDYWVKRGVPHVPGRLPFGSYGAMVFSGITPGEFFHRMYKRFPKERYFGAFELFNPILVVRDPNLIKQILVADFNHFMDRFPFSVNPKETILRNLFIVDSDPWKSMRHKSSPAFSSGKMKNMFVLMVKCSQQLTDCLKKMTETQDVVDAKNLLSRFTMDIIATCAFGVEINSLSDERNQFYEAGLLTFKPRLGLAINQMILSVLPTLGKFLNLHLIVEENRDMFTHLISKAVEFREKHNYERNDFLDILIKIKNNQNILDGTEEEEIMESVPNLKDNEGLSLDEMVAQAFVFFVAGFETASSTMTFCLYELAQHQEEQQRLWQEIQEVLQNHEGQLTYQALQEMKYMDQVINETLRMYPSLFMLVRRCTQAYPIPDSDLVIEKGMKIYIPSIALHHDPQYYPEPYHFDPERFSPENVKGRHPYVHLPFGAGPRNCIGMRFGLMQTKVGLATFLSRFRVEVTPQTPIPMKLIVMSIVTQSKTPVYLKVSRRLGL